LSMSSLDGSGPGAWTVSGVLTQAFASSPQYRGVRRWVLRSLMLVIATVGECRANANGTAVYFIGQRSLRKKVTVGLIVVGIVPVVAALFALETISTVTAWVLLPSIAMLMLSIRGLVKPGWASGRAQRELKKCRPLGPKVVVHSVASVERGAGARLLEDLNAEADRCGWTLVLDAANEALAAKLYAPLGYEPTGEAVAMPWGEGRVPMARYPRRGEGGDRG
jgi:hypothetical protein